MSFINPETISAFKAAIFDLENSIMFDSKKTLYRYAHSLDLKINDNHPDSIICFEGYVDNIFTSLRFTSFFSYKPYYMFYRQLDSCPATFNLLKSYNLNEKAELSFLEYDFQGRLCKVSFNIDSINNYIQHDIDLAETDYIYNAPFGECISPVFITIRDTDKSVLRANFSIHDNQISLKNIIKLIPRVNSFDSEKLRNISHSLTYNERSLLEMYYI